MKNLLINESTRLYRQQENYGRVDEHRGIGATTSQALSAIATAIANPTKHVRIEDHFGGKRSDEFQLVVIKDIVSKLALQFFEFGRARDKKGNEYFYVVSNHVDYTTPAVI